MCGIAGIVHRDPARPVEPERLRRMCHAIRHRGPDGEGEWVSGSVGLGHRRLSIIDLSPAGRQPMPNEDETVWLTFNGEIYNFRELRRELEAKGHHFRSRTDSEVIVHLYEEEGDECLKRLDGMFALAIWDAPRRRLLLGRDRVGKKPLKYAELGGDLVFASELKSLLAAELVDRDIDLGDVDTFLSLGYVPPPGTGFRHIRKLPPGHRLVWEGGVSRVESYWQLDYRSKRSLSPTEWDEAVRGTVRDAVARRMISDVPLGAFLSGGIDSSIVVACMAEASSRPIQTFSIAFEHLAYNESPHARALAKWCATDHHEFTVRADDASLLPRLASLYEEPYADSSALPTYLLARETRRHVTVALSGDGGDEGFFGYERYARMCALDRRIAPLRKIPGLRAALRAATRLDGLLPPKLGRNIDGFAGMFHPDVGARYFWMIRQMADREKERIAGEALRAARRTDAPDLVRRWMNDPRAGESLEDRMSFADVLGYLPGDVLMKVDLATMAHGLEVRAPLLDHRVLELAASAPPEVRYSGGLLKSLLRRAFRDMVPPGHFDRPKRGFAIPLQEWFRGPWQPLVRDVLLAPDARVSGYLDAEAIRTAFEEHVAGRISRGYQLWSLLMLELWHREVVEGT